MESGILPLLYVIALIGAVVLTVILSLLLSINILKRRKDFAVMKTLGSPQRYLPQLMKCSVRRAYSPPDLIAVALIAFPGSVGNRGINVA